MRFTIQTLWKHVRRRTSEKDERIHMVLRYIVLK